MGTVPDSQRRLSDVCVRVCVCVYARAQSSNSLWRPWTVAHQARWNFPGKNTDLGCHFLLQRIFWSRDQTSVSVSSALAGGFFTTLPPGKLLKVILGTSYLAETELVIVYMQVNSVNKALCKTRDYQIVHSRPCHVQSIQSPSAGCRVYLWVSWIYLSWWLEDKYGILVQWICVFQYAVCWFHLKQKFVSGCGKCTRNRREFHAKL